jgi:uncharacterized membrane protein
MSSLALPIAIHITSAVIWVGGMFFAYMALRPVAASQLEPPQRLQLWQGVFKRFFPWVWAIVILLPASGYWMVFGFFGGMGNVGVHIHFMQTVGWLMIALFALLFFQPYARLKSHIAASDWPAAGEALARIRKIMGFNLILGIFIVILSGLGR